MTDLKTDSRHDKVQDLPPYNQWWRSLLMGLLGVKQVKPGDVIIPSEPTFWTKMLDAFNTGVSQYKDKKD